MISGFITEYIRRVSRTRYWEDWNLFLSCGTLWPLLVHLWLFLLLWLTALLLSVASPLSAAPSPASYPCHPYHPLMSESEPSRNKGQGSLPTKLSTGIKFSSCEGTLVVSVLFCEWQFEIMCVVCVLWFWSLEIWKDSLKKSRLPYIWANLEVKSKYCLNARPRLPKGFLLDGIH